MGGMMPAEEPPEVAEEVVRVSPDLRPPEGGANGAPAGPLRLNIHPGMLTEVRVVPFSPAPESHLLDLNKTPILRSHCGT